MSRSNISETTLPTLSDATEVFESISDSTTYPSSDDDFTSSADVTNIDDYSYDATTYSPNDDLYYDEYLYTSFDFERPVYLYIWEILVIVTCLVNIVVISILMRKHMRNATNVILAAIAVTDSLTGLTTLPTYIMVYLSIDKGGGSENYYYDDVNNLHQAGDTTNFHNSSIHSEMYQGDEQDLKSGQEVHVLSKSLCQWFMISKLFLSKSFHTMSIFLTVALGIQRYISVAAPLIARSLTTTKAVCICFGVFVISPFLHIYHLLNEKAVGGLCEWTLEEKGCKSGCIYLWAMFIIRQFIPCTFLLVITVLFIRELRMGEARFASANKQPTQRIADNRRIAVIVTAILIAFLISEVPYGFFMFYNAIDKAANDGANIDAEVNRAIHMAYEILLVLSFHANFYIYTLFNRKFRKCLSKMFVQPFRSILDDVRRLSSASQTSKSAQRQTELVSMQTLSDRNGANNSNSVTEKTAESTAFMTSFSADITQSST